MSDVTDAADGAAASIPVGARIVIALGLLGLLAGFLWGIADVPRYTATAGVVVPPDEGETVDRAELARVAARGESQRVALTASTLLGGDVAGGDLLSDVEVVPAPRDGGVVVRATADAPDIAAATAEGYADAIVEEGGDRLERGAQAVIPPEPSENRSAVTSSAIGLLAGLLLGGLAALLLARRAAPRERARGEREPSPAPVPARAAPAAGGLAEAFAGPVLAARVEPARLISRSPGGRLSLDPEGAAAIELLADELEIDAGSAPSRLAVLGAGPGSGAPETALALAVTAAELGLTVIAVDAATREPALADLAGAEGAPGLADYLEGDAGPRDVLRAVPLGRGRSVVCLPAGERRARTAEEIDPGRLEALLDRLPRVYDLVLVSGPPAPDPEATALAERTDGVVLVATEGEGAPERVAAAVRELGEGTVLTGVIAASAGAQSGPQATLRNA